jgi:hypothetical protein
MIRLEKLLWLVMYSYVLVTWGIGSFRGGGPDDGHNASVTNTSRTTEETTGMSRLPPKPASTHRELSKEATGDSIICLVIISTVNKFDEMSSTRRLGL